MKVGEGPRGRHQSRSIVTGTIFNWSTVDEYGINTRATRGCIGLKKNKLPRFSGLAVSKFPASSAPARQHMARQSYGIGCATLMPPQSKWLRNNGC